MNWQVKKKKTPKPNKITLGILQRVLLLSADSTLQESLVPAHTGPLYITSSVYIYFFIFSPLLPPTAKQVGAAMGLAV